MPTSVRVTGLTEFVAELTVAESRLLPDVTAVVSRGSLNIKKDWQDRWKALGLKHLRAAPWSVNYDVVTTPGAITGVIGPDLGRKQGNMAFILELGEPSTNTAPHPGGSPALDAEAPKFEAALDALVEKLLP